MMATLKRWLRPWFYRAVNRASLSYVAGLTLAEAAKTDTLVRQKGYQTTLAYWNADDDSAEDVVSQYMLAMDSIVDSGSGSYLSIKAPAFQFDSSLFSRLLDHASNRNVGLHFDSLAHDTADRTLELLSEASSTANVSVGCSLPGSWQRSLDDADFAIEQNIVARVVKGQWPDPKNPGNDPVAGFLKIVDRLAGRVPLVRVATHDPDLAQAAIARLRSSGTDCEMELLYGLPVARILPVVRQAGIKTRMYIPYGHAWVPYCLDQVMRRPAVLGWILKDAVLGSSPGRLPRFQHLDNH